MLSFLLGSDSKADRDEVESEMHNKAAEKVRDSLVDAFKAVGNSLEMYNILLNVAEGKDPWAKFRISPAWSFRWVCMYACMVDGYEEKGKVTIEKVNGCSDCPFETRVSKIIAVTVSWLERMSDFAEQEVEALKPKIDANDMAWADENVECAIAGDSEGLENIAAGVSERIERSGSPELLLRAIAALAVKRTRVHAIRALHALDGNTTTATSTVFLKPFHPNKDRTADPTIMMHPGDSKIVRERKKAWLSELGAIQCRHRRAFLFPSRLICFISSFIFFRRPRLLRSSFSSEKKSEHSVPFMSYLTWLRRDGLQQCSRHRRRPAELKPSFGYNRKGSGVRQ